LGECNNNTCTEDDACDTGNCSYETDASESSIKKWKKNSTEELREYLQERDDKFLNAFKEMQEKQNKLMEKLIEKL
jgi:hypothetical protein